MKGACRDPAHRPHETCVRDPGRRSADLDIERLQAPGDEEGRRFTLDRRVGGQDHLAYPALPYALQQAIDREILRTDAVQR